MMLWLCLQGRAMLKFKFFTLCAVMHLTFATGSDNTTATIADDIKQFQQDLVTEFSFKQSELDHAFSHAHFEEQIIKTMERPYEKKSYTQYHNLFVTPERISKGKIFMQKHKGYLQQISKQYGVSPEIIVAIIGVESNYGAKQKQYSTLDSLYTLAFHYPKRAKFFRYELAQFFLLCRELGLETENVAGSYAGALGIPQFMPSNYRHLATSTENIKHPDLFNSFDDAIASIANYLKHFGWESGQPSAISATISPGSNAVINQVYSGNNLAKAGIIPTKKVAPKQRGKLFQIEDEANTKTWLGFTNFKVIKRYNNSDLYALAVTELADAIIS